MNFSLYTFLLFFIAIGIIFFIPSCVSSRTYFMRQVDMGTLKDGTYIGKDTTVLCTVKLATTLKDGKIAGIKILSHMVSYPLAGRAYDIIPKRIIEKQSLDVDAVTMATVSSNNIKRAILNSLEKANQ